MNFTNLILWSAGIITAFAGFQNMNTIQRCILKAQAKLVYESRTETWGTHNVFTTSKVRRSK